MDKIRIITDTASDISIEEAKESDIELLPITITVNGKAYRELFDLSKEEFWNILEKGEEIPKTSQITPPVFLDAYKKAYEEGYNKIIVVTINAKGSGTFNSANLAAQMFLEEISKDVEIKVIDSGIYTYCYGKPVLDAGMMIKEGKTFDEVVSYLTERLPKMRGYAYISTLKFAKASGRISLLSAIVGEALGLKPILDASDGKVDIVSKTRGEKAAISTVISKVKEDAYDIENNEVVVVHGNNEPEVVEKVINEIKEKLNPKSIYVGKLGCCITNNAGPQTIGILYYGK